MSNPSLEDRVRELETDYSRLREYALASRRLVMALLRDRMEASADNLAFVDRIRTWTLFDDDPIELREQIERYLVLVENQARPPVDDQGR